MNKKAISVFAAAFLLLVLLVWMGFTLIYRPGVTVLEHTAALTDLSGYDFQNSVYYHFDGYWESYPERLYTPEDFAGGQTGSPVARADADYRVIQYATHRIRLKLPEGEALGIYMKSADYSMRIFIDGRLAGAVGNPAETAEETVPRVLERAYYFTPESDEVEIVVQAANFVHREGAYPPNFYIGRADNIGALASYNSVMSALLIGGLITAALYHLGLFALNRRHMASLLFSACCLLLALLSNKIIPMFFPEYNWFAAFQIEYIVHFLTFAALTRFLQRLFPALLNRNIARVYYLLCAGYILFTFVFKPRIYSGLLIYFEIASVLVIVYILVRLAMALRGGTLKNVLAFAGVLVVSLFAMNDLLYSNGVHFLGSLAGQYFTTPIGMMFFVFCYGLVISMEYADTERAMREALRRERMFAEENSVLEELGRMKTEFLGNISHELKTPLAVISTHAQLVGMHERESGAPDEYTAKKMLLIASEAERMSLMVSQLLDISRIEEDKIRWQFEPLDITELIRGTMEGCYPILNKNHNTLSVELPDYPIIVSCDGERIRQALLNLVSNAIRFTKHGRITVSARSADGRAIVSVTDTGAGIAPEALPNIFSRYYTSSPGGEASSTGTGLGLYLTKLTLDAHGGEIHAESAPEGGTIFTFSLPEAGAEEAGHE